MDCGTIVNGDGGQQVFVGREICGHESLRVVFKPSERKAWLRPGGQTGVVPTGVLAQSSWPVALNSASSAVYRANQCTAGPEVRCSYGYFFGHYQFSPPLM